jgi:nucleoside-triphosphatase
MKSMPKVLLTSASELELGPMVQRIVDSITGVAAAAIEAAGFIRLEQPGKKGRTELVIHDLAGVDTPVGQSGKAKGKWVGKFAIDEDALEGALLNAIGFRAGVDLYVIHEIGPVETLSRHFSNAAKMLLKKDEVAVLATVSKQGRGFVREVKRLPGINAIEVNEANAAAIEEQIIKELLMAFAARAREAQAGPA